MDYTNNWYMHNPAAVLENSTHKLLWDFDMRTDHLISARRPDQIIINKKEKKDHRIKLKEYVKKDKYHARELKKTMEHENDNYTNCDWCFWYSN